MTPEVTATVPTISLVIFAINILLGIAFPVAIFIFLRKKYHLHPIPFIAGGATLIVFALILEPLLHNIVLLSPIGNTIYNNLYLYALYGGLAAGVFEETGRFIVMKLLLKKYYSDDRNALMFGAGHGSIEAFVMLSMGFVNNIIYSTLINTGMEGMLFESVPAGMEGAADQLRATLEALKTTDPLIYLISPIERIPAIALHISLSVIVWFAVTRKGKGWMFPLAILLHALADGIMAIAAGLFKSVLITELWVVLISACLCFIAYRIWKANRIVPVTAPAAEIPAEPAGNTDEQNEQGDNQ